VKFPGPGPRQRAPKNELIAEDKLAKAFKIASEQPYYDTINMGGIKSWTLTAQQAAGRLDMSRGTFRVLPNARQEFKLTLRFGSVDTDELKDLEVRFNGDSAQYKVGEGDCNHYVIANDKKLWESQFMILSKDGRFYIRDLGVVHTSRLKVTPNTSLQLHQGSLIDLGKVVHYHVNKLTHELEPVAQSNEQYIVMRGSHSDYKADDEAILRARPAWISADENRDMVQNEILLESTVKKTSFDIGRSNKRDVELKLKAVSADHCKIEYTKDKGWLIHEQGKSRLSSNGTFVFMKSHQQMEDHEPSDLIPLFNGMIISFINYELQVKIEPKTSEELSQSKFDPTYPKDLFSGTAKLQAATKVGKAFAEPTPGGGMSNFSIPQSQREEGKAASEVYSERFDGTAPS
jgi:predicted component of type VI protein secretion system